MLLWFTVAYNLVLWSTAILYCCIKLLLLLLPRCCFAATFVRFCSIDCCPIAIATPCNGCCPCSNCCPSASYCPSSTACRLSRPWATIGRSMPWFISTNSSSLAFQQPRLQVMACVGLPPAILHLLAIFFCKFQQSMFYKTLVLNTLGLCFFSFLNPLIFSSFSFNTNQSFQSIGSQIFFLKLC